jgi:hypothetical protein
VPFGNVLAEGQYHDAEGKLILVLQPDPRFMSASTPLEHWTLILTGAPLDGTPTDWSYEIRPVPPGHYGTGHVQVGWGGGASGTLQFPPAGDGEQT